MTVVSEDNNDDKKAIKKKLSVHTVNYQTIMLETDSSVFVDVIIKSFMKNVIK